MPDLANKLQIRFFKMILKVGKSTPTNMVLGELGQFPVSIQAKCRMLNFWYKLAFSNGSDKLSCVTYRFLFKMYESGVYKSKILLSVHGVLNELGFSDFWHNQTSNNVTDGGYFNTFKALMKNRLQDQFVQTWHSEINNNEFYYNYRMYKENFEFEKYLSILPVNLANAVLKFRTLNHKLPIQKGRTLGIPRQDRICHKCSSGDLGDEFHYIFVCPFFTNYRKQLLRCYYYARPNSVKFRELFSTTKKSLLLKLAKFMTLVMDCLRSE